MTLQDRKELKRLMRQGCEDPTFPEWMELEELIEDLGLSINAEATVKAGPREDNFWVKIKVTLSGKVSGFGISGSYRRRTIVEYEWYDDDGVPTGVAEKLGEFLGLRYIRQRYGRTRGGYLSRDNETIRKQLRQYPELYADILKNALKDMRSSIERKREQRRKELERFNEAIEESEETINQLPNVSEEEVEQTLRENIDDFIEEEKE